MIERPNSSFSPANRGFYSNVSSGFSELTPREGTVVGEGLVSVGPYHGLDENGKHVYGQHVVITSGDDMFKEPLIEVSVPGPHLPIPDGAQLGYFLDGGIWLVDDEHFVLTARDGYASFGDDPSDEHLYASLYRINYAAKTCVLVGQRRQAMSTVFPSEKYEHAPNTTYWIPRSAGGVTELRVEGEGSSQFPLSIVKTDHPLTGLLPFAAGAFTPQPSPRPANGDANTYLRVFFFFPIHADLPVGDFRCEEIWETYNTTPPDGNASATYATYCSLTDGQGFTLDSGDGICRLSRTEFASAYVSQGIITASLKLKDQDLLTLSVPGMALRAVTTIDQVTLTGNPDSEFMVSYVTRKDPLTEGQDSDVFDAYYYAGCFRVTNGALVQSQPWALICNTYRYSDT